MSNGRKRPPGPGPLGPGGPTAQQVLEQIALDSAGFLKRMTKGRLPDKAAFNYGVQAAQETPQFMAALGQSFDGEHMRWQLTLQEVSPITQELGEEFAVFEAPTVLGDCTTADEKVAWFMVAAWCCTPAIRAASRMAGIQAHLRVLSPPKPQGDA